MSTFSLVTEPWIEVRRLDGSRGAMSLAEVFTQAHEIRSLSGELPTQDAAILRLLLAILHRSLAAVTMQRRPAELWAELWGKPALPAVGVRAYLDQWSHRFDLFDAQRPFMQVAGLHTSKNEDFGLERLIADIPTGEAYFTQRSVSHLTSISTAEAARWLVHCHAYDPSGIKSGAVGDDRVKGGRGYPIGCGWAGQIGLIIAEGETLAQTLKLNLVLSQDFQSGTPSWERETGQGPGTDAEHGEPVSGIDTLVWQSRRIRLVGDDETVTRVLICNGDRFEPQNMHKIEASTAWRRSPTQEKKLGLPTVYMPKMHQPDRALWRGLEALLASLESGATKSGDQLSPALISWLQQLRHDAAIEPHTPIRFRAIGIQYGSNNSVISEVLDDQLRLSADVLTNPELRRLALDAVHHADDAVRALADLASDLVRAAGGETAGPRARAFELGYQVLDPHFRRWAATLDDRIDPQERLTSWDSAVSGLLWPHAQSMIRSAGAPAFIGRTVQRNDRTHMVDSGTAELHYARSIRSALPNLVVTPTAGGKP